MSKLLDKSFYTRDEVTAMYGRSQNWFNREIIGNPEIAESLYFMGYKQRANLTKNQVMCIFRKYGAPKGYEWYDQATTEQLFNILPANIELSKKTYTADEVSELLIQASKPTDAN